MENDRVRALVSVAEAEGYVVFAIKDQELTTHIESGRIVNESFLENMRQAFDLAVKNMEAHRKRTKSKKTK